MDVKENKVYYTCDICGGKPILYISKLNHEKGKKHNNIKNGIEIIKTPEKEKLWTCEYCNQTMQRKNQTNHEKSIKHQDRVKSLEKCPTSEEDNEE